MNASSPLIRTFRARDARSALTAVKAAFGPDAVIIETKQIDGGLFGRSQIEVTAAADAAAARPAPRPQPKAQPDRSVETDVAAPRRPLEDGRRTLVSREATDPRRDDEGNRRPPEPELGSEA